MKKIYNTAEMDIVALRHSDIVTASPNMDESSRGIVNFGRGSINSISDDGFTILGNGED